MQDNNFILQHNIGPKMVFNTVAQIVASVITSLIGLAVTINIARNLKIDNFGIYTFVLVFINFFKFLMYLVAEPIGVQAISVVDKEKASLFMGNVLIIKLFLAIITILAAIVTVNLLGYPAANRILVYIGCVFFISSVFGSSIIILQANLKMVYAAIADVLCTIVYLIWVIISFQMNKGLPGIIWGWVISDMLRWLIVFFVSWRILKPTFVIDMQVWQDIFKKSLPIWLSGIFAAAYYYMDTLMLSKMKGNYDVGLYSAAYRIINFFIMFPQAVSISVFPWLAKLYVSDRERFKIFYYMLLDYMLIIVIPLVIVIFIFSNNIVLSLFSYDFLNSVIVLRFLVFALPFMFLGFVTSPVLLAINQRLKSLYCAFFASLVNIILNAIFIPKYGFKSAAVVVVLTQVTLFFMMCYYIYKCEKLSLSFKIIPNVILINIVFGVIAFVLKSLISIYYAIPLLMFIYCLLIYLSKCIDIRQLFSVLKMDKA